LNRTESEDTVAAKAYTITVYAIIDEPYSADTVTMITREFSKVLTDQCVTKTTTAVKASMPVEIWDNLLP